MKDVVLTPLEQRLEWLVAAQTTHDNPAAFAHIITQLERELKGLTLSVERFGEQYPMVYGSTRGTRTPKVLFLIHLDVVPEAGSSTCALRVEGDKCYGRGVYDMKFAGACVLEMMHDLAAAGTLQQHDFAVLFTTDEEVGGFEVEKVLATEGFAPGLTVIPDGGEGWTIEHAAKGLLHGKLEAHGRAAHGSRPWEGDNALDHLLFAANELKQYHTDDKDGTTVSINQLYAGKAINQIPDEAILRFDARSFVYEDLTAIDERCQYLAETYGLVYTQEVFGYPCILNEHHDLTQEFIKVMTDFLGRPVSYSQSYAATDGRWFAQFNLPVITLRIRGGDIHGPEEWIMREDLPRFTELLKKFVLHACKIPVEATVRA